MGATDLLAIQAAVRSGEYRFTLHAAEEMTADRISVDDFVIALLSDDAEIAEDYPGDLRGASCLIAGRIESGEYIHFNHALLRYVN
jgi:hypothetical protein